MLIVCSWYVRRKLVVKLRPCSADCPIRKLRAVRKLLVVSQIPDRPEYATRNADALQRSLNIILLVDFQLSDLLLECLIQAEEGHVDQS